MADCKSPTGIYYPIYHCRRCEYFFRDRKGTVKEDLDGQQSEVINITCEACKIEAELPVIPKTGTVAIMIHRKGGEGDGRGNEDLA